MKINSMDKFVDNLVYKLVDKFINNIVDNFVKNFTNNFTDKFVHKNVDYFAGIVDNSGDNSWTVLRIIPWTWTISLTIS